MRSVARGHRAAPSRQLVGVTDLSVPVRAPDGHAFAVLTCPFIPRVVPEGGEPPPGIEAVLGLLEGLAAECGLSG
jgi:DNA-binding IclR family transcriptional regulator